MTDNDKVIYCSNLPNDQDMIQALGSIAVPLPIASGDCLFSGIGDDGNPICISVERKKISDMSNCVHDGRYLRQLQTAAANGTSVFVLIVEGDYRSSPKTGILETPVWNIDSGKKRSLVWVTVKPIITYSRFDQYLTELDWLAGVVVKRSRNVRETADIIRSLYINFMTPPSRHNSLHRIFKSSESLPRTVLFTKPSLIRRVASDLPGIGWDRSKVVAEHFGSVYAMCQADVAEWASLDGIGKKTAQAVVDSLRGSEKTGGRKSYVS